MRFIDASVFIYAYLKPKTRLPNQVSEFKKSAKRIVTRLNEGEEAITTLIHISEVSNILEARFSYAQSVEVVSALLSKRSLEVVEPSLKNYLEAIEESRIQGLGINDALALLTMRHRGINEIYSFDSDFDKVQEVRRIVA